MQEKITEIIRILWSKQLPFVAYRLPGEKEVLILVQTNPKIQSFNLDEIESVSGFVLAPFKSAITNEAYLLKPTYIFNQNTSLEEVEELPSEGKYKYAKPENRIWSKDTYLKKAHKLISDLKNNKLQKLVLSRVIEKKLMQKFDPGQVFFRLNEKFHHSFNYIFHLPLMGSWIGASPEIFFRVKDKEAETVSLAGTKHVSDIKWTLKERHEQAIVTDFISHQLEYLGIANYSLSGLETVSAGQVAHLSTKFRIPLMELENKTAKLLQRLHPTPAVCGLPKKEALEYILKTEDHDRKFYTGFLGPWRMNQRSELFVNLRCAEFSEETMHVFVGGGFTSASDAESEWSETNHKSDTLLSVAENF